MKENGERKLRGNCRSLLPTLSEVQFVQTEAYISAQCILNYQKKKTKSITRVKIGRNKKM